MLVALFAPSNYPLPHHSITKSQFLNVAFSRKEGSVCIRLIERCPGAIPQHLFVIVVTQHKCNTIGAACSLVATVHDWDLEGSSPRCSHDKICTAFRPLGKALNPALLQAIVSCLV